MKYKTMRRLFGRCYFAAPVGDKGAGGTDPVDQGNNGGGAGAGSGDEGKKPDEKKKTFDDMLADGWQSEFDRRVNSAVQTAIGNARAKWQLMTDDKVSEAEKLAKMTDAEKNDYLTKKRLADLDKREAEITKRELTASAKNTLADKGLPVGLAEFLDYTSADACKKSLDDVEKTFRAAVQEGVEERLKGKEPMKKAGATNHATEIAQEVEKALRGHI